MTKQEKQLVLDIVDVYKDQGVGEERLASVGFKALELARRLYRKNTRKENWLAYATFIIKTEIENELEL